MDADRFRGKKKKAVLIDFLFFFSHLQTRLFVSRCLFCMYVHECAYECLSKTLWDLKCVIAVRHGRVFDLWRKGRDTWGGGRVNSMHFFRKSVPFANVLNVCEREDERAFVL